MITNLAAIAPLAAGLDWLEGLLPLLFVAIWLVSQVMNLFRGARNQPARPPEPQRPPGGEGDRRAAGEINREVEAFLRRTLELEEERGEEAAAAPSRRRPRPVAAEPPPPPARVRPRLVGGERIADGREDVAGHVAAAFAHDLAHAAAATTTGVAAPTAGTAAVKSATSPATDLAATLRRPGGLRQLVLMQELLTRPTHRW